MQYLRLILLPFSWLYGLIIIFRNIAYDKGWFSSRRFRIPVVSVGNLAVGGAGKSPLTEYIIRLLKDHTRVAVLSRGYGRSTKGFRYVSTQDTADLSGDEPLQFRRKFDKITVAVAEKRVTGIEHLEGDHDVVILDDAYQHRAVNPGLSLLLFDYTALSNFRLLLPAGNMREPFAGRKRADALVVTKTPEILPQDERSRLISKLSPFPYQKVFFSYLDYGNLVPVYSGEEVALSEVLKSQPIIFLLTGIANPRPLVRKLESGGREIKHYDYPDHHPFSPKNISKLAQDFRQEKMAAKVIVTTEKDAQRLRSDSLAELLSGLPVYYLPVQARIHEPDKENFDHLIEKYVSEHLQHG